MAQTTNGIGKSHNNAPSQAYSSANRLSRDPPDNRAKNTVQRADSFEPTRTNDSSISYRHHSIRTALGLHAQTPIIKEHIDLPHHNLFWSRIRLVLREPFAEFLGVFVMVCFGNGSVAQVLLSEQTTGAPGGAGFGGYQSISWGWGIGVMFGIYVAGDSGAYLNPAVTLANCVYRGLPWRRFPVYLVAQFLGGFVGSGVVYANYINAINDFAGYGVRTVPPATTATAQIFCTYPQAFLSKTSQFFSEFIASTLLILVIFALKDNSNTGGIRGDGNWFPLGLFFLIFGLGACFGYETGYAINFARDFGPRLMSYILGYGSEVWTAGDYYFWVPIVAPACGCLFGGFLYDLLIYTGPESPLNSPWLGIPYLLRPDKAVKGRWEEREEEVPGGAVEGYVDPERDPKAKSEVEQAVDHLTKVEMEERVVIVKLLFAVIRDAGVSLWQSR